MWAVLASSVYSGVGLKTISTGRSIGFGAAAPGDWTGALGLRSNPAVCTLTLSNSCAAPRGEDAAFPNPPVATAAAACPVPRGEGTTPPNPPVATAAAAWFVRGPLARSKRPVSGGCSGALVSRGRSGVLAGRSVAGAGSTGLLTIGVTATGFGTFAITASCTGRDGTGREGRRGASRGIDRNFTSSAEGNTNMGIDRGRDGFSEARIGTTPVRMPATVACTMTLIHRPVLERVRGRCAPASDPAWSNRTDICSTKLK